MLKDFVAFFQKKYWWRIDAFVFSCLFSLWILAGYNFAFWEKFYLLKPHMLFFISGGIVLFLLAVAGCQILMFKYTLRFWSFFFCFFNGIIFYFMDTYHIPFDKIMLLNVLETDPNEVKEIFNFALLGYLLFFFVFPVVLIFKTKIMYKPLGKEIFRRFLFVLFVCVFLGVLVLESYKTTAQFMRNNRSLRYLLVPANYIGAVISVTKIKYRSMQRETIRIGDDASLTRYWHDKSKKNLLVLVVGETARAANFSLNGYARKTDEKLLKHRDNLLNFTQTFSCGTSTAVSLPCMFSSQGRRDFDEGESAYRENLLDVIQKVGYKVLWRENNTGCKGICKRVETEDMCSSGACFDEVLLQNFGEKVRSYHQDMVVVLHQMGSHGPTYYRRYPKQSKIFEPVCNTERLDNCSREEIVNVYDNTIAYTAQNLDHLILELKRLSSEYNVMMVYISDHGESLGENNIYLHAAPYLIAPKEQKHVPFLVWADDDTIRNLKLNWSCMQRKQNDLLSHDHLFHSVLGILGIQTDVYDKSLDIWNGCRIK